MEPLKTSITVHGRIESPAPAYISSLSAESLESRPGVDGERDVARLAQRILTYRVFPDADDRMNRSLVDDGLGLLLVPQFTLAADTKKGTRASFTRAAAPDKGEAYFGQLVESCRERLDTVETGRFGATMKVRLTNDGPVTFWLET